MLCGSPATTAIHLSVSSGHALAFCSLRNAGTSNCRCGLGRARALALMEQGGAWGRGAHSGDAVTRAFQKYVFSFTHEYFSRCEHALLLLRRLREAEVEKGSLVKEALVHPLTTFALDLFTRH